MFKPIQDHVFKERTQRQILGQKLAFARLQKGLSQAEALRLSGLLKPGTKNHTPEGSVTRGFLTYIEGGDRGIMKDQLAALAKLYGISMKHLLSQQPMAAPELRTMNLLQLGMKHRTAPGRVTKPAGISDNRQIMAAAPTKAARRVQVVPEIPARGAITAGDIAILDKIRDCSEPEKIWIANAIDKLKERMRPAPPRLAVAH